MKIEDIKTLFEQFEAIACEYEGVECWSARELCKLLGYAQWRNFEIVINKAKVACETADYDVKHHFADVSKMIGLAKGATREVDDYMLTRYACYLVAPQSRHCTRTAPCRRRCQKGRASVEDGRKESPAEKEIETLVMISSITPNI